MKGYFSRGINLFKRFLKRLISIWPINIMFIGLILISVYLSKIFKLDLNNILLNLIIMMITVYLLDFLYLEQDRRSTANKRYLVDYSVLYRLINKIESEIEIIIDIDIKNRVYIESKDTDVEVFSKEEDKGAGYIDNEIEKINNKISINNFWEEDIDLTNILGNKDIWIRKKYFKKVIKEWKKDIDFILLSYGNFMFYENFKAVFDIKETLNGYYFMEDVDFDEVSSFFISVSIYSLLVDCKEIMKLVEQWN